MTFTSYLSLIFMFSLVLSTVSFLHKKLVLAVIGVLLFIIGVVLTVVLSFSVNNM